MKTTLKSFVAKMMTAGLLAGALMLGTSQRAEAQVSIGVQIGGPAYGPVYRAYPPPPVYRPYPGYYARQDYYARMRWEQARRAEWARRQAWRDHHYYHRGHGHGYGYGRGR